MRLVNLTPHVVTIFDAAGAVMHTHAAAEAPARVMVTRSDDGTIEGVPIVTEHYGRAELPEPVGDVRYIVSVAVALAHPERADLLVPTDLVRTEEGTVVGCRALSRRVAG
ncbi:hypothetical protein [Salinactinospora qingdaonensis]|uniref:Uncharacterized protein n=1 Tax=Salinactinospora qingdaonensis TaxID=702744 RepID=A0ABP7FYL0_9ACTN